jgi:hypothetical protein
MASMSVRTLVLRYQGLFDLEALYRWTVQWLTKRNYEYLEKLWKEKDATPIGREISIKMVPEKAVSEYVKYELSINWLFTDAHEVEVVRDGRTVKLTHARFNVQAGGKAVYDWQEFSKDSPKLGKFYNEFAFKRELNNIHWPALQGDLQKFMDDLKAFLQMETSKAAEAHNG